MVDSELLSLILYGPTVPENWRSVAVKISQQLGADVCLLTLRTPTPSDLGHAVSSSDLESVIQTWLGTLREPGASDGLKSATSEKKIARVDLTLDTDAGSSIRAWADRNRFTSAMHGALGEGHGDSAYLSVFRRSADQFSDEEEKQFREMLLPLAQGTQLARNFDRASRETTLGRAVIDTLFVGVAVSTEDRVVLHANEMARGFFDDADAVFLDEQRLTIAQDSGSELAAEFIRHHDESIRQRDHFPENANPVLVIPRKGRSPLTIITTPLPEQPPEVNWRNGRPAAVTFLSDPEHFTELAPERIRRVYGLTAAEADLAIALANGKSLRQAAEDANRSEATLRKHLQSVFAKTETHRQSELVSLLLRRIV